METEIISVVTCPACGSKSPENVPNDSCLYFYECRHCHEELRPMKGDCCVFCSYGGIRCPSAPPQNSQFGAMVSKQWLNSGLLVLFTSIR